MNGLSIEDEVGLDFTKLPPTVLFLPGTTEDNQKIPGGQVVQGISVDTRFACASELVRNAINDKDKDQSNIEISCKELKLSVLTRVVEYLNRHKGTPPTQKIDKPLRSAKMIDACSVPEDATWIDQILAEDGLMMIYDITIAMWYFRIPAAMDLFSTKIGSLIWEKRMDQVDAALDPTLEHNLGKKGKSAGTAAETSAVASVATAPVANVIPAQQQPPLQQPAVSVVPMTA